MENGFLQIETDKDSYQIAIDNKNVSDMKRVMSEFSKFGYNKIVESVYKDDTIIVYAKEK